MVGSRRVLLNTASSLRGATGSGLLAGPMTGSATKQSSWASGDMDCFASLAMTKIPLPNSRRAVAACDLFLPVEFGATARQLVRAHLGDIVVIELPGGVLAPAQR